MFAFVTMRAFLAYHLVAEDSTQTILEQLFTFDFVKMFIDAVHEMSEELESILLFAYVDRLTS